METLDELSTLISLGLSLQSVLAKSSGVDLTDIVHELEEALTALVHGEIVEQQFCDANTTAQTIYDDLQLVYPIKVAAGESPAALAKYLVGLDVVGTQPNTASPGYQSNLVNNVCLEPETTIQEQIQGASIYLNLVIQVLTVLQETARQQTAGGEATAANETLATIKTYAANRYSTDASHLVVDLVVPARNEGVAHMAPRTTETIHSGTSTAYIDYILFEITDPYLAGTGTTVSCKLECYGLKSDILTRTQSAFEVLFAAYQACLDGTQTGVEFAAAANDMINNALGKWSAITWYGHSPEALGTELQNFGDWLNSSRLNISTINTLALFPLGVAPPAIDSLTAANNSTASFANGFKEMQYAYALAWSTSGGAAAFDVLGPVEATGTWSWNSDQDTELPTALTLTGSGGEVVTQAVLWMIP